MALPPPLTPAERKNQNDFLRGCGGCLGLIILIFVISGAIKSCALSPEKRYAGHVRNSYQTITSWAAQIQEHCQDATSATLRLDTAEARSQNADIRTTIDLAIPAISDEVSYLRRLTPPDKYATRHEQIVDSANRICTILRQYRNQDDQLGAYGAIDGEFANLKYAVHDLCSEADIDVYE